jgi:hypothetical protein
MCAVVAGRTNKEQRFDSIDESSDVIVSHHHEGVVQAYARVAG